MHDIFLFLSIVFLLACQDSKITSVKEEFLIIPSSHKLEKLLNMPKDSVIDYYDLSNDLIMELPDLSGFTIRKLNLSHNYLEHFKSVYFPQGIEVLNLSYNYLTYVYHGGNPRRRLDELKELYLSHNYIQKFVSNCFINRLDLSYNDLSEIAFNWCYVDYKKVIPQTMNYLNISNNPDLSNEVYFAPSMIDTIIDDNISNKKKLQMIDWRMRSVGL